MKATQMTIDLERLNPDDARSPYQQIYTRLRAAILTGKVEPGHAIWSQNELADHFAVSRNTIKEALKLLKTDGLVVAQQGGRTYAKARTEKPVGLGPHIELAFGQPQVTIDFAGYTSETLDGVIREPLDKIRSGELLPESIVIRLLLSDMTVPQALPATFDGGDDPDVRARMAEIMQRHTASIVESIGELQRLGLVPNAAVQVRVHSCAPLFKLYVLNATEVFFGFYPVREHTVTHRGKELAFYDPMGMDATLFHHTSSEDSTSIATQHVEQSRVWFDSMWNTIAREYTA